MKTMKCSQLGGPDTCSEEFKAKTWEEIKQLSMSHGNEMAQKGDKAHLEAMEKMKSKMADPDAMQKWMDQKKQEFESLG